MTIIIVVFVLCVLIIILRRWLITEREFIETRRVNVQFERHNIIDCNAVNVPCVVDDQCRDNCSGGLVMHCNEGGFCARGLRTVTHIDDCDVSRGQIMVFNAIGGLVVENLCVSVYRDVVEDGGELRPYVCEHGTMYLDLENGPFQIDDCVCDQGFVKFSYSSGSFSRPVPVCIPNKSARLFNRLYVQQVD
ncbi:pif-3 [Matsumuraeses phaseoli granulovirus]|uniref:Pif-3 n=1 Tax=Matsumuraeses phaseoli granulovirus TaxID=2760664 RepID=A0AAE7MLB1_9BBAC|nr:pif-3 [Matsumuraeses phaseoli granulovirus]QOD39993.1 pif-3 [Matsumuraeses phaseoli granulovirus]